MARRAVVVATFGSLVALACTTSSAWQGTPQQGGGVPTAARDRTPDVQLWVNGNNFYHRGERARVYFRTDDDAFVVVMRIDTDGRTRVLFPESPLEDNFVRGGVTYRVPGYGRETFYVDDYPGMGYVFAIASWRKLDLTAIGDGRRWDYELIGDRVSRDPFTVMHDLAARLTGNRQDDYALDVTEYHVDRREDYPRFLCYECHAFRAYSIWNPYAHRCAKFRIVVYDDPFYYPYRYYPGTRVVYLRHQRRWPRYELLDRGGRGGRGPYVEKKRRAEPDVPPIRSTPVTSDLSRRTIPPSVIERPGGGTPSGGDQDPRIIRPRRSPPVVQTPARTEPERSEPERSEPRRVDPRRAEPREREPREREPQRVEPRERAPRRTEPDRTEPQRVEPRRVEPRESEPRRPEPQRVEPRETPREQPRVQPREAPPPRREVPSDRRVDPRRVDPR